MRNYRYKCWPLKFVFVARLFFYTLLIAFSQPNAQAAEAHFVLISHGADGDPWWNIVKNAVRQANEDFGVQTDYLNPANGDLNQMVKMIRQAAQGNYDGVITTCRRSGWVPCWHWDHPRLHPRWRRCAIWGSRVRYSFVPLIFPV